MQPTPDAGRTLRLQKFLSAAGVCSRRRAESHILAGDVRVNGSVVRELGTRVDPSKDRVTFKGRDVKPAAELVYIALHKPVGIVTTCHQPGERIVLDLVALSVRLYPIGRLDKDSSGLILLTNDGSLHHRLLHPSFDHEKTYEVTVVLPIDDAVIEKLRKGVALDDGMTRPARVSCLSETRFRIVLKEGRNRQIRRMVEAVGNRVTALRRTLFAGIRLGNLAPGKWRHLTAEEVAHLKKSAGRRQRKINP